VRQAGERQAMNAGIQGLAADIFKIALVRLDEALEERGGTSRLILQVHDEVVLEVPPADEVEMSEVVLDAMSGAFDLAVPPRGQPGLRRHLGRRQVLITANSRYSGVHTAV
jgi:DNA polymerase-1